MVTLELSKQVADPEVGHYWSLLVLIELHIELVIISF